jgi:amino acid adenylation domain-containing protein
MPRDGQPKNLVERVRRLASTRPHDTAIVVFNRDAGANDRNVSYREIDARARAVAALLQQRNLSRGARVLLMLEGDDHYVIAFLACQYAGLIAVPAFPPSSSRSQHAARLTGIAYDARAACILATRAIAASAVFAAGGLGDIPIVAVDAVDDALADEWRPHVPNDDDVAFLQYTSGSTSAPKGVMVSHGNLTANLRAIQAAMQTSREDVFVSWAPPFHDMGLIGGLLQPLHSGAMLVLMTPEAFLERPVRWLEAMSRYRGAISGGPDFAYRLCVERIRPSQMQGLDLSHWRIAYSGAEPVRHDTLEAFKAAFCPFGLPVGALFPCYGLAEATLFVTGGRTGAGATSRTFSETGLSQGRGEAGVEGRTLVACGHTMTDHILRIVDPDSFSALQAGRVGEIWVSGPSVSGGYWGKARETAETFVERDGRRWLRTGDLGFLCDGELYVTGRIKDMIIVRGHNLYPQDIETSVAAQLDVVRKGRVAAFAVEGPAGDGIGLAVEVSRATQKLVQPEALAQALGVAVSEACGEPLAAVLLLNPGGLPKTSSGKLRRSACRQGLIERSLDAYAIFERGRLAQGGGERASGPVEEPTDETEIELVAIWKEVLGSEAGTPFDGSRNFFVAGGNSLAAVQAASRIADRWAIDFPVSVLFERPQLADCAGEIRRRLAEGARRERVVIPLLSPAARSEPLELSHAQQRLWFLWQMDPGSSAYHISGVLRLTGAIDEDAVRRSFEAIVARHEALRTVFRVTANGEARQLVLPDPRFEWSIVDLRGASPSLRDARRREAVADIHERPFDLSKGPLLRVGLIREGDDRFSLAAAMHHIVSDGWSIQLIIDEFSAAYRAAVRGEAWTPAPLALQYIDYAAWQRRWLEAGEGREQLAWWRARLGDEHPVLELPTDHPRRPSAAYASRFHDVSLPRRLADALREQARRSGSSVFTILLSAFQALLYRYSGQSDIRIGATANNRTRVQTERVVGFFVNMQVQRAVIDDRTTLAELLGRTKEAVLDAQTRQDLPFEQLVEALQPGRDLSHSPLFRVAINHRQIDHRALADLPDVRFDELQPGEQAARFELTLDTAENAQGEIAVRFLYARELFDAQTVERLAAHYLQMVEAFTGRPDALVAEIELLRPEERARLLSAGRPRGVSPAGAMPLHRRIERQAALRPDHVAVVDRGVRLSYGELDLRANRIAHRLIERGVRPEARVGLAVERSADLVVAILAILKAGAGYVPLDPSYPHDRLAYMTRDSGVCCVLADSAGERSLDAGAAPVLRLDALLSADGSTHDPGVACHEEHVAYVIYTSGSTGRPKGAQLTHRNVSRLLDASAQWFGFGADDVWTLFHSYAFDFSVWEIFGALCSGGSLVVAPFEVGRSPEEFVSLLREQGVTVLNQTPSAFRQLMQTRGLYGGEPLSLRLVIFGGEALAPEDLRPWIEHFGDAHPQLVNMYGITETTVHVTYRRIGAKDLGRQVSPIGQAIADLGLYVLDERLEPAPLNAPGELHVSGAGLARGYARRAGLTAQRFVADPFDAAGGRLYRTGDLARRRADGQIEYLGRIDDQVKIRGFRIELGEIETRLRERPEVKEAIVVARGGGDDKRLIAYVAPDMDRLTSFRRNEAGDDGALATQWKAVFDSAYAGVGVAPSFRGWNSSYTDMPIPEPEMQEWLDGTVRRILSLRPRRILEIGCGVGLLVRHLAPRAESYCGSDLSSRAVTDLRKWLATQPALAHVTLRQNEAVDFQGVADGKYDTALLNSVVQYFPDIDYLVEVLRGAARAVGPRGHMFVGDLRHLAHLPMFHASVQLSRARPDTPLKQLKAAITRAASLERELVIDPALFHAVAAHLGLGGVRIELRRGAFDNELTRYRYDAILSAEPDAAYASPLESCDWEDVRDDVTRNGVEALAERLEETRRAGLRIGGVPNRRLARDLTARRLIETDGTFATAGELRKAVDAVEPIGVDPEEVWSLGERLGYEVHIGWTPGRADGSFDVEFAPHERQRTSAPPSAFAATALPSGWRELASDPLLSASKWELGQRLREYLQTEFPDYMTPSLICVLDAMPLTPSGKLDRGALPDPGGATQLAYEPPQGEIERALASIWSELLSAPKIGRKDNFFDLGGHSLSATQMTSRLKSHSGYDVPLREVFKHPVLSSLAAYIEARGAPTPAASGAPLEPLPAGAALTLSPTQRRLWLAERLAARDQPAAYNIAAGIRFTGALDLQALRTTLETIAQRHDVLRTYYPESDDGDPTVRISDRLDFDLCAEAMTANSSEEEDARVHRALSELARRRFDLGSGPLLRAGLLRLQPSRHVLLLCVHHIVFDGWSISVFIREFVAIYRAVSVGGTPSLPPLPIRYVDYAYWRSRELEKESSRNREFWRAYLDLAPKLSTWPSDHARPEVASMAGDAVLTAISRRLVDRMDALARLEKTSAYTVMLAAFLLLLHRRTGAQDLIIGADVAGRPHPELEKLIGFFVNVVPVRARVRPKMTFAQWLSLVKEASLSAFEHADAPFDDIIDFSGVARARQHSPLFQMLFVMQNAPRCSFSIPGLEIETIASATDTSKFDLGVFVAETSEGLCAEWVYATSLYRRGTIEEAAAVWHDLLERVVADPHADIGLFATPFTKESNMSSPSPASAGKLHKLRKIAGSQDVAFAAPRALVRTSFLSEAREFPIVVEATGSDIDAASWAAAHREFIETALRKHGGILFRNFGLETPRDFEVFVEAIEPDLYGSYGDLPKKEGGQKTYRSTPYPERQMILFHNESSHTDRWPRKQWFFCELPARVGGATPIVDGREMLRRLPSALVEAFERKGLLYVRTFTPGLDVSWRHFYKTDQRSEVETRLRRAGIAWKWLGDDTLQTRTRSPAIITHPITGERAFFNQIQLHHISCLEPELREDLIGTVGLDRMPRNVFYGDGSPIEDDTMAIVGRTYEDCAVRFDWRRGDVVMLDNMLAAHARDPYEEPRKIVVAMGAMYDREPPESHRDVLGVLADASSEENGG